MQEKLDFNAYAEIKDGTGYHLFIDQHGIFYRVGEVTILDNCGDHCLLHQTWAQQFVEKNPELLEEYFLKKEYMMLQSDKVYRPYDFLIQEYGWVAYFNYPHYLIHEQRVQNYYECIPLVINNQREYTLSQVYIIKEMIEQNTALPSLAFIRPVSHNQYALAWYQEQLDINVNEKKR